MNGEWFNYSSRPSRDWIEADNDRRCRERGSGQNKERNVSCTQIGRHEMTQ